MPAAGPRMLPPSPSALPGCTSRSLRAASGRRDGFAVGKHTPDSAQCWVYGAAAWLKKAGLEAWAWGSARRQCGSTGAPAACGSALGTSGTPPHPCSRRTLQQHAEQSQARWQFKSKGDGAGVPVGFDSNMGKASCSLSAIAAMAVDMLERPVTNPSTTAIQSRANAPKQWPAVGIWSHDRSAGRTLSPSRGDPPPFHGT